MLDRTPPAPKVDDRIAGGAHTPRIHDSAARHVSGSALYIDDMAEPDQLVGHVLRSPVAHARVREIDVASALAAPVRESSIATASAAPPGMVTRRVSNHGPSATSTPASEEGGDSPAGDAPTSSTEAAEPQAEAPTESSGGQAAGKAAGMGLLKGDQANVQQYVTGKALDGLFLMIGEQEKKIRQDPVGTGSAILKKVFGS